MKNVVKTFYIAEALNLSRHHVSLLIRQGQIEAEKFGNVWAIPKAEADRFIAEYLANPPTNTPKKYLKPKE